MDNDDFSLELTSGPAAEPVTVAEQKSHSRVDGSTDDTIIGNYITAARQVIERLTARRFGTQTWKMYLDEYPEGDVLEIPIGPVQSVSSIKTTDADAAVTTFVSTSYLVDIKRDRARIVLKDGMTWPAPAAGLAVANAVTVEFICGYATAPEWARLAVRMLAAHFYEHREATNSVITMNLKEMPMGVKALIGSRRIKRSVM